MFAIQDVSCVYLQWKQLADRQTLGSIANWVTARLGYKPTYYHIRISNSFKRRSHVLYIAQEQPDNQRSTTLEYH
jgi:hypothetical protein